MEKRSIRLCIALAVLYGVKGVYGILERAASMFIDRYAFSASAVIGFQTGSGIVRAVIFGATVCVLLLLLASCIQRRYRTAMLVLAAGAAVLALRLATSVFLPYFDRTLVLALVLVILENALPCAAFVLLACAAGNARDLRGISGVTAGLLFLHTLVTALSGLAGVMLTASGELRLWIAVLVYTGRISSVLSVAAGILPMLCFILLTYALRSPDDGKKIETLRLDAAEAPSENTADQSPSSDDTQE